MQPFLSLVLLVGVVVAGYAFHSGHGLGREASFSWWVGIALGVVLVRSRFCFFCNLREAVEEREVRPLLGILTALGAGCIGAAVVFGAWIPDAGAGFLPPRGHISPAAWPMVVGGAVFGLGMVLSGSCISAHFYRLAEGSGVSVVALVAALGGFAVGDAFWNPLYLISYRTASPVWLPGTLGFGGALLLSLGVLIGVGAVLWSWWHRPAPSEPQGADSLREALLVRRWPWWAGGLGVAVVATAALLRTQPLGVTAELTRLGHQLYGGVFGAVRLEGVEGLRGCIPAQGTAWLSQNAVVILGLVAGAFIATLAGRQFEWEWPTRRQLLGAIAGGVLLGVGARVGLGCTVGTLYGGITAFSLSGWLFALGMGVAVVAGLPLRRRWITGRKAPL